ncbi:MAG: rRNA pseudouridine synthase [Planctomycetes bacterium]|nr:rRNA pseudouridine synthase [Planctomycetota bacterium]
MRRRSASAHPFTDDRRGERIQKVLAQAGVASRRECEAMVAEARVRVNGIIIDALPAWVDARTDKIEVDGRPIRRADPHVYIMLYKPKGIVCTNVDPEGRRRVIDLVQHPLQTRLFPVGRLEIDASGLVLLTNDGEFANRLTHPRYEVSKTFELVVAGRLDDAAVSRIESELFPSKRSRTDDPEKRSRVTVLSREAGRTTMLMEIRDGKNTEIRLTMLRIGYPLKRLRQIAIGPLQLRGITVGAWRELSAAEFASLKKAAFKPTASRTRPDERGEAEESSAQAAKPALKFGAKPMFKPAVKGKPFAKPTPRPASRAPQRPAKPSRPRP